MTPQKGPRPNTSNANSELKMSARQKRQQARLLKAAKEGKDLNDSYYDELESEENKQHEE